MRYTELAVSIAALHAGLPIGLALKVPSATSPSRLEVSPIGTPFPVGPDGPTWTGPTGTSFLPTDTIKRAEDGNPIEKAKLAKDASTAFNSVYEFAAAIRAGTLDWEDIEKADMNTRLKWVGLVHRDKRTPGRFMMRLRTPNGIVNADLMRFYADCVEPCAPPFCLSLSLSLSGCLPLYLPPSLVLYLSIARYLARCIHLSRVLSMCLYLVISISPARAIYRAPSLVG